MTEIIKEYAEALFSLACETGEEQGMLAALNTVADAFLKEPRFLELVSSPAVPREERLHSIERAFGGIAPADLCSFLCLLCEKGRIREIEDCRREYRRLHEMRHRVVRARVISAVPLTEQEKNALRLKLEKNGGTVTLDCVVDPEIMGGVIVETEDRVIDGSLRHRLREMKDVMKQ